MNRHPLDGNAIAADKHYGRDAPEMRECDQCDGAGMQYHGEDDRWRWCRNCGGQTVVVTSPVPPSKLTA